jgi:hypothetical protein
MTNFRAPYSLPNAVFDEILDNIDIIALEQEDGVHEFDAGDLNYNEMKTLVANQMAELYLSVMSDETLTSPEKTISLISSMSYLAMQNFVLQYEKEKGKW